jgi:chromosome segregation ATPase
MSMIADLRTALEETVAPSLRELRVRIEKLEEKVDANERRADQRFEKIDQRFDKVEQRFDRLESAAEKRHAELLNAMRQSLEISDLAQRLARVEAKVSGEEKRA